MNELHQKDIFLCFFLTFVRQNHNIKIMSINKNIDKAQSEAAALKEQGVKKYIWSREVKLSLGAFLITVLASFILGAIAF